MPQAAGPGDVVTFVVQVANVGYHALEGIRVVVRLPRVLSITGSGCEHCAVERSQDGVDYLLGDLNPGQQVIFAVTARVAEDAWPDQLLVAEWTLRSPAQSAQVRTAEVTLPWAPLPATGLSR